MAIVEFTKDCYPYCKGDRIQMDEEELKDVDALAKERAVSKPYKLVDNTQPELPGDTVEAVETPESERVKPLLDQAEAEKNLAAPGVEAVQEKAAEVEAKVAEKKDKK